MVSKEPVAIASALSTIIGFAVARYLPDVDLTTKAAFVTLALAVVSSITAYLRSKAFSENTIREAGLEPKEVEDRAADPQIPRKRKRANR